MIKRENGKIQIIFNTFCTLTLIGILSLVLTYQPQSMGQETGEERETQAKPVIINNQSNKYGSGSIHNPIEIKNK